MKILRIGASMILVSIVAVISLNILTSFHALSQSQQSVSTINGGEASKHYVPKLSDYDLKQQQERFLTYLYKFKEFKANRPSDINNTTTNNQNLQKCRSIIKQINESLDARLIQVKTQEKQIQELKQSIKSLTGGKPQACAVENNQISNQKRVNRKLLQDAEDNLVLVNNLKKDILIISLKTQKYEEALKQCENLQEKILLLQSSILVSQSLTSSLKNQIDGLTENNKLLEVKLTKCYSKNGTQEGECKRFVRNIIQTNNLLTKCQNDYRILQQQQQDGNQPLVNHQKAIQDQLKVWTNDIARITTFTQQLLSNNNITHLNTSLVNKTLNKLEKLANQQFITFRQASSSYSQYLQEVIQALNDVIKNSNRIYSQKVKSFEDAKSKLVKGLEYATQNLLACNNKLTGRK